MATARRKAPKAEAPQTIEDAVAAISEYRDLGDKIEELKTDAERSITAIETARDTFTAPLEERAKDIFRRLRIWWGVAAPAMTDGKRKSMALAGCTIGERTTPHSLKLPAKAETFVEDLAEAGLRELLRITEKVDKQACIRSILAKDELGHLLIWLGATTEQKEEFFIDLPRKDVSPEAVEIPEAVQ
ncbi:MAG TPA: host-nuclease inhibitor Gam family protein [Sphingobium sp.]